MKLSELRSSQRCEIIAVEGRSTLRRRLMEMGFVKGQQILVVKNAPLKDPIEYQIMGYEVSLRRAEAEMIRVRIVEENATNSNSECESKTNDFGRSAPEPKAILRRSKPVVDVQQDVTPEHDVVIVNESKCNSEIPDVSASKGYAFEVRDVPASEHGMALSGKAEYRPTHSDVASQHKTAFSNQMKCASEATDVSALEYEAIKPDKPEHDAVMSDMGERGATHSDSTSELKTLAHHRTRSKYESGRNASAEADETEAKSARVIRVALVGNPNCGKTTLFNTLSGLNEHTGNYSGVTVDVKTARLTHRQYTIEVADLPGTYSLSAFSPEEKFVRDYLTNICPDVVINVVDGSNLERNLYLTTQLIDLGQRSIMALNMYDEFLKSGDRLDKPLLSSLLGMPIIPTESRRARGVPQLLEAIISETESVRKEDQAPRIAYQVEIERLIERISEKLTPENTPVPYTPRYVALRLIESGENLAQLDAPLTERVAQASRRIAQTYNQDLETLMAESRYGFISGALRESYTPARRTERDRSTRIDQMLTHRIFGLPIFLGILWLTFYATFTLGEYPMGWIESGVDLLKGLLQGVMSDGALKSLLINGVMDGVGSVIVFLPNILLLFFFISVMEDTGYMARAAFITDKLMHKIGLHGKSFIPLIMGFGCNVPAIMATRIIENRENRLQTMLIAPFMSCSARLPIYILITGTFFPDNGANVLFMIYLTGILLAIVSSLVFKKLLFKGKDVNFVMELPPYRIPTMISTVKHMWNKAGQYLQKMGGIILVAVVIIWALGYYPNNDDGKREDGELSYLETIGHAIEPVIAPLGFDWRMGISLATGVAAKEVIVSTMSVIYHTDPDDSSRLSEKLEQDTLPDGQPRWNKAVALSFLAFILIYFPCIAVVAAIRKESGAWIWAIFTMVYTTALAYGVSFVVYRLALLFL